MPSCLAGSTVSFGRTKCDRSVVSNLKRGGPLRKQALPRTMGGSKCTNHSPPSWRKWWRLISPSHRLKETNSKQSKLRDLHLKWLYRETNDNTLCYCIYHDEQQQPFPHHERYSMQLSLTRILPMILFFAVQWIRWNNALKWSSDQNDNRCKLH